VSFGKRMDANSKTNTAHFWENVRVLNMPGDDPNQEIDLDTILATELPEGAMYLRCERLKVLDQPVNGRSNQQMEAYGRVYVQAKEFYARADAVFYNQAKDQIIFDGKESGVATLCKVRRKGEEPQVIRGKKIIYHRTTGEAKVDSGDSIRGRD
jgi:lipopolysaccharide export system protein LptA